MTDFRALCVELVDDLELCDWPYKLKETIRADINRARAALAEEPAVPTVMEIVELADEIEAAGLGQVDLVRAALTRWRNPAPQPVPVSERLPGPEDCDAEGRCWWWRTDDADEWWELLCISNAWEYNAGCGNARYTHWLPAHALPVPGQEVR